MNKPPGLSAPTAGDRGAKIGVYGQFGTGKTNFIMSATEVGHLLVLDCEGRTQLYDPSNGYGFEAKYSADVTDAITLLDYATDLQSKGERVIFAIDGFSTIWFAQQQVAEDRGATTAGTAKFQSWAVAKRPLKIFYDRLFTTPVDCIISMRAKPKYEVKGSTPKDLGYDTPDMERGLGYAVDTVLELHKDHLGPGIELKPDNFFAVVIKTSGPRDNNPLPIGMRINDPVFSKVMALRLSGTGKLVEIAGVEAGVHAALVRCRNKEAVLRWAEQELGMDARLVDKEASAHFQGKGTIEDNIIWVWSQFKAGRLLAEDK